MEAVCHVDNAPTRRYQWNAYLGPTKELIVGEYNVFIFSSAAFRNRTPVDNSYFRLLDTSLLIADSSMT